MPRKKTKGTSPGRTLSAKEISETREMLEAMPELERASELFKLAGNATRLKLLHLLRQQEDLPVGNLAERLGVSVPVLSLHLAKLRIHRLVASRREAQSRQYRLTDHPFNEKLRAHFLPAPSGRDLDPQGRAARPGRASGPDRPTRRGAP